MKKFILLLTLLGVLALAACDGSSNNNDTAAHAGKYLCTEISMDGLTMNPDGKWLSDLLPHGGRKRRRVAFEG